MSASTLAIWCGEGEVIFENPAGSALISSTTSTLDVRARVCRLGCRLAILAVEAADGESFGREVTESGKKLYDAAYVFELERLWTKAEGASSLQELAFSKSKCCQ